MEPIKYTTGELVKVGDAVEIRRRFKSLIGVVTSVYDPKKPSPPWGENDYGITIQISESEFLWGMPDKKMKFLYRKVSSETERSLQDELSVSRMEDAGKGFKRCRYQLFFGGQEIGFFSHNHRGEVERLKLLSGYDEDPPFGMVHSFLSGGGQEPLGLTDEAKVFLLKRLKIDIISNIIS